VASPSGPLALAVALAIWLGLGVIGFVVDLIVGSQGWWLALGGLGLCFAGLYLAAAATRQPLA